METTLLNTIFVFSFFFVSVALGVKWIGEAVIQAILANKGLQMLRDDEPMKQKEEDDGW